MFVPVALILLGVDVLSKLLHYQSCGFCGMAVLEYVRKKISFDEMVERFCVCARERVVEVV